MPMSALENKREFAPFVAGVSDKRTSTQVNLDATSPRAVFTARNILPRTKTCNDTGAQAYVVALPTLMTG